ncbi:MAG TPA: isoprenylcysteine carboxylmethyltransferase family protein [bacterium]|nr:isoprenylcysteine carboxylmethyltransferase family protein [bacterium]
MVRISASGYVEAEAEDACGEGDGTMVLLKLIMSGALTIAIFGGLLFLPAGTLHWWRAWVFLGVVCVATVATYVSIFPGNEALLNERLKGPIQQGQPLADKIVTVALVATTFGLIAFIPLDVFRFRLMGEPGVLVSSLGLVLFVAGWWIIALGLRENAFAAPVVKLQAERHQTVIDTGVYAVVRHPMYAGGILFFVGMPLWLGSYAAALLASVPIATVVARATIEERFLRRELAGYDAYMARTRYRLIPFVW